MRWQVMGIDDKHINVIFLGIPFLTFVLIQIIASAFNSATESIPNWVHFLFLITIILILFLTYLLILFLDFGKIWKIFLGIVFLMIYFSLIIGYVYLIPHSYILYKFNCPAILEKNSKIELSLINEGKIVQTYYVNLNISKSDIDLKLNSKPISNNFYITTFPNDVKNYSIIFSRIPQLNNETISISNVINCGGKFNCRAYFDESSENKCEYSCQNNRCKIISIN